jgi:hypothetical protein
MSASVVSVLKSSIKLAAISAALLTISPPVRADLGLAGLHAKERIGNRTCMIGHTHSGAGSDASPQMAQAKAIRDWSEFTVFEYGQAWGNFALSADRQVKCGPLRADLWHCKVESRPCRT